MSDIISHVPFLMSEAVALVGAVPSGHTSLSVGYCPGRFSQEVSRHAGRGENMRMLKAAALIEAKIF